MFNAGDFLINKFRCYHKFVQINNTWSESPSQICNAITDYFYFLFNKEPSRHISLNWDLLLPHKVLQPQSLEIMFSKEEIKQCVFSLPGEKSLGPDGFPLYFYHHFWSVIKSDVVDLFQYFYQSESIDTLSSINQTFIALIPKKRRAERIQNFRPISLLNSSYKIISKCLATRLSPILNYLMDDSQ